MQKLFGYLQTQNISVVYSPDSTVENRNRTVYSRPLKAYRGIKKHSTTTTERFRS